MFRKVQIWHKQMCMDKVCDALITPELLSLWRSPSNLKGSRLILTDLSVITMSNLSPGCLFCVHHPMSQLTRCTPAPGSLSTVCSAPCLRPQSRLRAGAGAATPETTCPDYWQLPAPGSQTTVYKADPRPPSTQMARRLWRSDDSMLLVMSNKSKYFIDMEEVLNQSLGAGCLPKSSQLAWQ